MEDLNCYMSLILVHLYQSVAVEEKIKYLLDSANPSSGAIFETLKNKVCLHTYVTLMILYECL